jgi:membrane AbrB-like protein
LLVSSAGGALCAHIHTPLPWMIGPLFAMALCNFSGARLLATPLGREVGQLLVAVTLGLYFTPVVAAEVATHALLLIAAAFAAIAVGLVASRVLMRYAKVDQATAFFASVPGGAAEMANLGERFGAAVDKVAVAHSLRITLVVCTIPVSLTLLDIHGGDVYQPVAIPFSSFGLAGLMMAAICGGLIFRRTSFPNPWMMGPLLITILLTSVGIELSSMTSLLTNGGQVLLGCALGARFSRTFLREAPRFVAVVIGSIFLMMLLSTAIAIGMGQLAGIFLPSMVLAMAPGGIAEMSITAKTLQLGVALVTAAHVTRVVIIIALTESIYRRLGGETSRCVSGQRDRKYPR